MSNANEPMYRITGSIPPLRELTRIEHAVILLRVPMSGDDEIDAMIRAANRKDFAAIAMQAYVAGGFNSTFTNEELALLSAKKADALIAELERKA